jgi:subtilisin family serine protease
MLLVTAMAAARPNAAGAVAQQRSMYRPGVVLIGFQPGVSAIRRRVLQRRAEIRWLRPLTTGAAPTGAARSLERRIGHTFIAGVTAGREAWTVRVLRRDRLVVRFAELDYAMQASGLPRVPNDPSFPRLWGSSNVGQEVNGIRGIRGAEDKALAAWTVTTGRRSIVIGEVDTGVDYLHPDLAANIWTNPGGIGGCPAGTHGYNIVAGSCDPADDDATYNGHGTHVAGIMGAVGNNHIGVAGMNWSTTILPVKWLNASAGGDTDQLISGLDWLLKAKQAGVNIRVVNDSATFVGTPYSQALSDEVDLLGANNILFVTAAGNTSEDNDNLAFRRYPCGYDRPTEICVTATDQKDRLASFANWGAHTVDLGAPGVNIYSTLRNGTYGYIDGGSMAAAQVSGAAALILSRMPLSAAALRSDILNHVDPLLALRGRVRTGGRLDVCRAISACARGCKVPRLVGRTLQQAGRALTKANCRLGRTRKAYSSRVKLGRVISQSSKPGSARPIGTMISLFISKGKKPKR